MGGSTFTVAEAGTYFVSFSVVLSLASGTNKDFGIWLRKNGEDVPRSNSHCTVASANDDKTIAVTFLLALAAGDALTVYMRGTSTDLQLQAISAVTGPPARPAVPSIIFTINKVSD